MALVTPELVRTLAHQARLAFDPAELPRLAAELDALAAFIAALPPGDAHDVAPELAPAPPTRADVPAPALPVAQALAAVPAAQGGSVRVAAFKEDG